MRGFRVQLRKAPEIGGTLEEEDLSEVVEKLTTSENLVKVVLGAAAAFIAKKVVEDAVEAGFRHWRH